MGLAILTIVWYITDVFSNVIWYNIACDAYSILKLGDLTVVFFVFAIGLVIRPIVWYDRYTLNVNLKGDNANEIRISNELSGI